MATLQFNPATGANSIVYRMDRMSGSTVTSYPLIDKANDCNEALDRFWQLALLSGGTRRFDDSNNNPASDPPEFLQNIVSGQSVYPFPAGFLMSDLVLAKDNAGNLKTLTPVDISQIRHNHQARNIWEQPSNNAGSPTHYDETPNAIILSPIPNYNSTNGLKIVGSRGPDTFASTDTTASPGIPTIFHSYIPRRASLNFLVDHDKERYNQVFKQVQIDEEAIQEFFAARTNTKAVIRTRWESPR